MGAAHQLTLLWLCAAAAPVWIDTCSAAGFSPGELHAEQDAYHDVTRNKSVFSVSCTKVGSWQRTTKPTVCMYHGLVGAYRAAAYNLQLIDGTRSCKLFNSREGSSDAAP
jgi:hypothetical protein